MEIKNKRVSFLFNKFDLPIRFVYSKLGLNRLFFWKLYSSDFVKLDAKFEEMQKILEKGGYDFKDKVCLELGPGNSYVNAYNFLANGAKKVILVDKYPRYVKGKKQKEYIENEEKFIKEKYCIEDVRKEDIKFVEGDLAEVELNEKADFVYSISVFEHVKDVELMIERLGQIIKKGGMMYHHIDMRDHYNFSNPFLFLKYSESIWEKYLTKEGVSYTNRIRYSDYKKFFEKYGFEVESEAIERFSLSGINLSKDFNKKDDNLDVGIWVVLLKKV